MAELQTVFIRSVIADSRQKFCCLIFDEPWSFIQNKLLTYECVVKCCFEEQYNLSFVSNNKFVSFYNVVNQIKLLYNKVSILSLSKSSSIIIMVLTQRR